MFNPTKEAVKDNVISFGEITEIIEQQDDEMNLWVAQSLREWASVRTGECVRL